MAHPTLGFVQPPKVPRRTLLPRAMGGRIADLLRDLRSLRVALLHLPEQVGWRAAYPAVLLNCPHELLLRGQEDPEQPAGLLRSGLALISLLNGQAGLLGLLASDEKLLALRRRRLLRRGTALVPHPRD